MKTENVNAENVRDSVKDMYTDAIERSEQKNAESCCAPTCCAPAGADGQPAVYEKESQRYPEASASSFGCGNPLAFSEVSEGQTVLDLGSGAGLDLLIAADAVGPTGSVIGIDMTDAMIAVARKNIAASEHKNIEVRKGVIEKLPVDDNSVDRVISNCVINLSPDKDQVFAEIARVLKPGGRFSISDMVVDDIPQWLRENAATYAACIGGAIDEKSYAQGLVAAGLENVEVTDRHVYDAASLRAIVEAELMTGKVAPEVLDAAVSAAAGKVWSTKFVGTKR